MTGIELLRQIRARWPDTLRIILSGYSDVNTIITAVNEGEIYKFISKPWEHERLLSAIMSAITKQPVGGAGEAASSAVNDSSRAGGRRKTKSSAPHFTPACGAWSGSGAKPKIRNLTTIGPWPGRT